MAVLSLLYFLAFTLPTSDVIYMFVFMCKQRGTYFHVADRLKQLSFNFILQETAMQERFFFSFSNLYFAAIAHQPKFNLSRVCLIMLGMALNLAPAVVFYFYFVARLYPVFATG